MRAIQLICVVTAAGLMVCGCGGSSHKAGSHTVSFQHSRLPARARPLFASDQPAAVGHVLSATTSGRTVASLGFDLTRDGFSFENYGFIAGTEIDAHAMQELFGNGVCTSPGSGPCTLTYAAQQWAAQADDAMSGGHCFGFSVTALRFFKHNLSPLQFGGSTVYSLQLTPALQSEIAYGWASQEVPAVQQAAFGLTPTGIVHFLERALNNHSGDAYTIGIRKADGSEGHAITPTAIDDLGNGRFNIDIYDNNYPGIPRAISVDTRTDSWTYQAAPNPNDPQGIYNGQGTHNPMVLIPLSAELGVHPCPFCTTGAVAPGGFGALRVTLGGNPDAHGHLLIRTADGRLLGYVHGHFVDQIKGARAYQPFLTEDWKARPEPVYELPATVGPVQVTLDGTGATGHDKATVRLTGPGFGATVTNLFPQAGSVDRIVLGRGGNSLALRTTGPSGRAPTVQLAKVQGKSGTQTTATPKAFGSGAGLSVVLAPSSGQLRVATSGSASSAPVALTVQRAAPSGKQTVHSGAVRAAPGRGVKLTFGLFRVG